MDTIQVALYFLVSYLLSRVFVTLKIPEIVITYLIEKKQISIRKLILILILGSALISIVVLNMITVLTLMPLVVLLQKGQQTHQGQSRKLNTLYLLSVLWGANIGGIGTITGTTTNGILLGYFEGWRISGTETFSFLSWAVWGVPLIILMALVGWLILMLIFRPGRLIHNTQTINQIKSVKISRRLQRIGFIMAGFFLLTASVLSYLLGTAQNEKVLVLVATTVWAAVFIYMMLIHKWRVEDGKYSKLLQMKDALQHIPKWGLIWVLLAFVVTYVLWQLKLHKAIAEWSAAWISAEHSIYIFYLIFAMLTVFISELVSNTAVQVTMFMVLFPLAEYFAELTWQGMLIITLCSSCAFMSPLATPSNGLGFGFTEKISVKYLVIAGFVMNIISSLVIVGWVIYVVPFVLRFF